MIRETQRVVIPGGVALPLFDAGDRGFSEALSRLSYCNPFLPERLRPEREALGGAFSDEGTVWSKRVAVDEPRENIERLRRSAETLVAQTRQRLEQGAPASERELTLYEDVTLYWLYHRYRQRLRRSLEEATQKPGK